MKKIDLSFLVGKDVSFGINYADELFNKNLVSDNVDVFTGDSVKYLMI